MELVKHRKALKTGMPTDGLMILVGLPKSGKTSLSSSFPDSYVLNLEEKGADRVEGRIHNIKDINEFREVLKLVSVEPSIKTIVIDTVDALSDWLEDEIAQANGLATISERKKGVDGYEIWGEYTRRIRGLIDYLNKCGKLVILNAHCKEPKIDGTGAVITPAGINLPGKSGPYLAGQALVIGYVYKKPLGSSTAHFVTFQGGPLGTWGSRVEELNDKTIQIDKANPYGAFEALFSKNGGHK